MNSTVIKADLKLTPMLRQYVEIKEANPGCLLLFRLGDFYELFFDDALKAAPALDIVLTRRGKKDGQDIPMCGLPYHAADSYIARLIQKGFKVALCEQMESPEEAKKRGPKSVVKRGVVRILTPGTLTEDTLLESKEHNFLVAIAEQGTNLGVASVDISTGEFTLEQTTKHTLESVLVRLHPKEILLPQKLSTKFEDVLSSWKTSLSIQPDSRFSHPNAKQTLLEAFDVSTLEGFGDFSAEEIIAGGAILDYVALTQQGKSPALSKPMRLLEQEHVQIDAATRQSLEIHRTLKGDYKGSLLHTINRTLTAGGGRLLNYRLSMPCTNVQIIQQRQDAITWFLEHASILESACGHLKHTPDLERVFARLALGRGGPRDLASIREGLKNAQEIHGLFGGQDTLNASSELAGVFSHLSSHEALIEKLQKALGEGLPLLARDGDFIASGFHPQLDEIRHLRDEGKQSIAALQARYAQETGVTSLKIKHNHVLGYYVEVTAMHQSKMSEVFIHRQTLANNVRYTTVALSELEQKLSSAADQALALELSIFETLLSVVLEREDAILRTAKALSMIDVASSLAVLAHDQNYIAPKIDQSLTLHIEKGRHPTVEGSLKNQFTEFTPNDCSLSDQNTFWLITGPNMAGKSTFLRQNALIIILAQMGSYVPATKAHIGVVDKIFSRVGAADELAKGHSTFMVEMVETAAILNQSTKRSFVILDEIGRGTATYDGLSLAWATAEHLHNVNRSRTLFATHYHELGALKKTLPSLSCHTIKVKEWHEKIIFLHEVVPGQADRSYGIHVAELAGIPQSVVARAKIILTALEDKKSKSAVSRIEDDLPLLSIAQSKVSESEVERMIKEMNADTLTPRQALELIYTLKEKVSG